jgi:hypothetical protein
MKRTILLRSSLLVGLYLLYVGLGFPLISLGYVQRWPIFPDFYLKYNEHGASKLDNDTSTAAPDAPHIFYEADSIISRQVALVDGKLTSIRRAFSRQDRSGVSINCAFADHPDWSFSTRLADSLPNIPTVYPAPEKLLMLSDVEGNFNALRGLLLGNGVIDQTYNWTFEKNSLVVLGDVFDRGLHVTECLWLLYKLEQSAAKQGGHVHLILGNHELMNLSGDFRYVRNKYRQNDSIMGVPYAELYTPKTELGRWLATKNSIERVGDWLLVHGGISASVARLGIEPDSVNQICHKHYFNAGQSRKKNALVRVILGADGPHWYRGLAQGEATNDDVSLVLAWANCKRMAIGHTPVEFIRSDYDRRVYLIDTPHASGPSEALLIKKNEAYRVTQSGKQRSL